MVKLFTISDKCPPKQRELFTLINEALETYGVDADEFDRNFRLALCNIAVAVGHSALVQVKDKYAAENPGAETEPAINREFIKDALLGSTTQKDMEVAYSGRLTPQTFTAVKNNVPNFIATIIISLEQRFGRFCDFSPDEIKMLPAAQRPYLDQYNRLVASVCRSRRRPAGNLLQRIAGDEHLIFDNQGTFSSWNQNVHPDFRGIQIETREDDLYLQLALLTALRWAREKAPDQKLNTFTDRLTTLTYGMRGMIAASPETDRFQTAADLYPPAQRVFDILNTMCTLFGCSARVIDHNVKLRLMEHATNSPGHMVAGHLKDRLVADYGRADTNPSMLSCNSTIRALQKLPFNVTAVRDPVPVDSIKQVGAGDFQTYLAPLIFEKLCGHGMEPLANTNVPTGLNTTVGSGKEYKIRAREMLGKMNTADEEPKILFSAFTDGSRQFSDIPAEPLVFDWQHYRIECPSQRAYLFSALEISLQRMADEDKLKGKKRHQFDDLMQNLKAAFKEASRDPAIWRGEQEILAQAAREAAEAAQRAHAEVQRQLDEKKAAQRLEYAPFAFQGAAQSIIDRGNPQRSLPTRQPELAEVQRLRDAVSREILPIKAALNKNFAPHVAFGQAIFADNNFQTMRTLDHICTSARLPGSDAQVSAEAAAQIKNIFSLALDASPLHQANRERQGQLVAALSNAPMLMVAALGDSQMVSRLKNIQAQLFPENKKDRPDEVKTAWLKYQRALLAVQALEKAGITVPAALQDAAQPVPEPPPPPKPVLPPKPVIITPVVPPAAVVAAAPVVAMVALPPPPEPEVVLTPPADIPPPLAAEPVLPVIETPLPPPAPGAPTPGNGHGTNGNGSNGNGHTRSWEEVKARADKFVQSWLAEDPPFNMLRCNLGMQPGHTINIHLIRWSETGGRRCAETRSDTILLCEPSLEKALEMKRRLQSYLFSEFKLVDSRRLHSSHQARDDEFLPASLPIPDPVSPEADGRGGRIVKRSGVYVLRLIFEDKAVGRSEIALPLGLRQNDDMGEAQRRRGLLLGYLEKLHAGGGRMTGQDLRLWLQQRVARDGGAWQHAESIDLSQHPEIPRDMLVAFPSQYTTTILHVDNPKLEGTPNASWVVPIKIMRQNGGEKIELSTTRINTHIRDPNMALSRIEEITAHMRDGLERYTLKHPRTNWCVSENGRLHQMTAEELATSDQVDWTRLDQITGELPYIRQLSVRVSPAEEQPDGRLGFTLSLQRADGSTVLKDEPGRPALSVISKFIITKPANGEEQKAIEKFRAEVHRTVHKVLEEAYKPMPGKATQYYNPRSIVKMFDTAWRAALQASPGIEAVAPAPSTFQERGQSSQDGGALQI